MNFRYMFENRQQGVGSKSGKAYDFRIATGIIETARGPSMCEVMLDKDHPTLEAGKMYRLEIEFYADREKRLAMRVVGLVPAQVQKAA